MPSAPHASPPLPRVSSPRVPASSPRDPVEMPLPQAQLRHAPLPRVRWPLHGQSSPLLVRSPRLLPPSRPPATGPLPASWPRPPPPELAAPPSSLPRPSTSLPRPSPPPGAPPASPRAPHSEIARHPRSHHHESAAPSSRLTPLARVLSRSPASPHARSNVPLPRCAETPPPRLWHDRVLQMQLPSSPPHHP